MSSAPSRISRHRRPAGPFHGRDDPQHRYLDAWEREAADPRFFFSFSPQGYAVGLDVFLYAMTH
jgi:hypothetical protein